MQQFIEFKPVANLKAYGLGVQRYPKSFSSGKHAIGHGGGNIGTTTYMIFLPEYNVSIVVMINAFPNKCANMIAKGLIKTILKDANAIGLIPYFAFMPTGFILACFCISWTIFIIIQIRKRKKKIALKA